MDSVYLVFNSDQWNSTESLNVNSLFLVATTLEDLREKAFDYYKEEYEEDFEEWAKCYLDDPELAGEFSSEPEETLKDIFLNSLLNNQIDWIYLSEVETNETL